MKEVISLWSNLFSLFFNNLNKELNHFFDNQEEDSSSDKFSKNRNQKEVYKIPRLGR